MRRDPNRYLPLEVPEGPAAATSIHNNSGRLQEGDLLPNLPSFIRRVCSGYALVWGVLRTQSV